MRYKFIIILVFILSSCDFSSCDLDNKDSYMEIFKLIQENPKEFRNYADEPYIYYTSGMNQRYSQFESKISLEDFNSLKALFSNLKIKYVIIYDYENIALNVETKDFYLYNTEKYIAYFKTKSNND